MLNFQIRPTHNWLFYSPKRLVAAQSTIAAAYELQRLHAALLEFVCREITAGREINMARIERELKVRHRQREALRREYPKIFKIIWQYEKARRCWEKGLNANGRLPWCSDKIPHPDLLLTQLRAATSVLPVTA